jgi:hypothetical protein
MWTAMHGNAVKPVDVHSENWQLALAFADTTLLDELYGRLNVRARNRVGVAVDDRLRAGA